MKIRCITNSIRLRLRKSDIQKLEQEGVVEEKLVFSPADQFVYRLRITEGSNFHIFAEQNLMEVQLPSVIATTWIRSDKVSIESDLENGTADSLKLLIEKDFPCKHTDADFEDTFHELVDQEDIGGHATDGHEN